MTQVCLLSGDGHHRFPTGPLQERCDALLPGVGKDPGKGDRPVNVLILPGGYHNFQPRYLFAPDAWPGVSEQEFPG